MITIIAEISKDESTILFEKNSRSIIGKDAEPSVATPKPSDGADILNITRPTPINSTDRTHKYGTNDFLTGRI